MLTVSAEIRCRSRRETQNIKQTKKFILIYDFVFVLQLYVAVVNELVQLIIFPK
jgi:hypothetical protein